jgi:ribose transport system ATP-binding protein
MTDAPESAAEQRGPALEVRNASKAFGQLQALSDVSMSIERGSIHALIGRNGSGKSTLAKILAGYHRPDSGTVCVGGDEVEPWKHGLHGTGIAVVHQDLGVFPELSVMENFALGRGFSTRFGRIRWREEERRARAALERYGLAPSCRQPLSSLKQVHAVIVAMARALDSASDASKQVLILDEPTSFLPRREVEHLFSVMREASAHRLAILFVTHRLSEVLEISDHVTVLRDGRVSLSTATADTGEADLVAAMVGAEELEPAGREARARASDSETGKSDRNGQPALSFSGVSGETLRGVDLDAYKGEVLGITGLLASGIDELAYILAFHRSPQSGTVKVSGKVGGRSRVGLIPADRVRAGALTGLTIEENLSVATLANKRRFAWLSKRARAREAFELIKQLRIQTGSVHLPIETLSGGNQQKVMLGRWLCCDPEILVAEGPTQGIDVQAKAEVLQTLRAAADAGTAVIIVSYEAEEITSVCDRVLVLRGGQVVSELTPKNSQTSDIVEAMG